MVTVLFKYLNKFATITTLLDKNYNICGFCDNHHTILLYTRTMVGALAHQMYPVRA